MQLVEDAYEYHGVNSLGRFIIFALLGAWVLYLQWGFTTAVFKNDMQESFAEYGDPDWQNQGIMEQGTMWDAVEYTTGWMEFWSNRSSAMNGAGGWLLRADRWGGQ